MCDTHDDVTRCGTSNRTERTAQLQEFGSGI